MNISLKTDEQEKLVAYEIRGTQLFAVEGRIKALRASGYKITEPVKMGEDWVCEVDLKHIPHMDGAS